MPHQEEAFFGRQVTPVTSAPNTTAQGQGLTADARDAGQGGDAVLAHGWIVSDLTGQRISLRLSNQSAESIHLSAVADEYLATTDRGQQVILEEEFLSYPDILNPGEEKPVTLLLPSGLEPRDVKQILAKLNNNRTVIAVKPIGAQVTTGIPPGAAPAGEIIQAPSPILVPSSAPWPPRPVPVVPEPSGAMAQPPGPPAGTAPVLVEFHQALGGALKVDVRWNDLQDTVSLTPGDRRLFYVVPGQHELHFVTRIPSVRDTAGRVPVVVGTDRAVRIDLEAQARFSGAQIRVRIWNGNQVVFDEWFFPKANS